MIAHGAVMRYVGVGHEVVVAAHGGGGVLVGAYGPAVDRHILADDVLIADLHIRHHVFRPAHVLRGRADAAVGIYLVPGAYFHIAVDINVSHELVVRADLDVLAYYAVRSYFGGLVDNCSGSHDGGGMYGHGCSFIFLVP